MNKLFRFTATILLVVTWSYAAVLPAQAQERSQADDSPSATDVLRSVRSILITTRSVYFKPATLENELLKRPEFEQWGLVITREKRRPDLIIEVDRKLFTSSFVYIAIDARTNRVLMSGRVNSIGGTVEGKITDDFIKRMKQIRPVTGHALTK